MSIPDNLDLFDLYDREKQKQLDRLPKCSICGQAIQDERLYLINDEFVCPECLERDFMKDVDDYVE